MVNNPLIRPAISWGGGWHWGEGDFLGAPSVFFLGQGDLKMVESCPP